MPSFVVETYVPAERRDRFAGSVEDLRAASDRTVGGTDVRHVRSFLVPGDEMGFHVLEASTAGDVARVTEAAGIEVERVVEVVAVDVPETEGAR
jgi:hypothetical protein